MSKLSFHSVGSLTAIKANTPHSMVEDKSWKNTITVTAGYFFDTED